TPHTHRIVVLPLAEKDQWHENIPHPAKQKRVREFDLTRSHNTWPSENGTRQNRDRPRKPPCQMHQQKFRGWHSLEIVRCVVEPAQMAEPFCIDQITKISRKMPLDPDVPWRNDQKEDRQILPA